MNPCPILPLAIGNPRLAELTILADESSVHVVISKRGGLVGPAR